MALPMMRACLPIGVRNGLPVVLFWCPLTGLSSVVGAFRRPARVAPRFIGGLPALADGVEVNLQAMQAEAVGEDVLLWGALA